MSQQGSPLTRKPEEGEGHPTTSPSNLVALLEAKWEQRFSALEALISSPLRSGRSDAAAGEPRPGCNKEQDDPSSSGGQSGARAVETATPKTTEPRGEKRKRADSESEGELHDDDDALSIEVGDILMKELDADLT